MRGRNTMRQASKTNIMAQHCTVGRGVEKGVGQFTQIYEGGIEGLVYLLYMYEVHALTYLYVFLI